ncbi:MAG: AI-2E family transporter [Methanotrichaceae archaeon]
MKNSLDSGLRSRFSEDAWMIVPIALVLLLVFYFLFPLLDGIVLGVVFAYVGRPIKKLFGDRRRLGSLVATTIIILPIALIVTLGTVEIVSQLNWVVTHQSLILSKASVFIRDVDIPTTIYDDLAEKIYDDLTGSLKTVIEVLAGIVANVPVFSYGMSIVLMSLNFVGSIFVCYFLLLDGGRLVRGCSFVIPPEMMGIFTRYCERVDSILSGIFVGSIYTAILGGIISVVVFYAFGIPKPFALASFVFIAGMVPVLTAWLVIVPIALYRYLTLGLFDALFFFTVASVLIYLPSELIIRPYIVSTKSTMHPLLVMLSFVGGALVAGIGGLFLAPALMGMVVGAYQIRKENLEAGGDGEDDEDNEG